MWDEKKTSGTNLTADEWNNMVSYVKSVINSFGSIVVDAFRVKYGRGPIQLGPWHTELSDGLSDEEVARIPIKSDENFEVWRLSIEKKGGGTDTQLSVDVFDEDRGQELASTYNLKTGDEEPLGVSGDGGDILIRCTNDTGSSQTVSVVVKGYIVEA